MLEIDDISLSPMNPVLACIEGRRSTRAFSEEPVTDEERRAILHAASRAPSAGAMMFYSVIEVCDAELRKALCRACDDQPFMLKAPLWLLFCVDNRKWLDLYAHVGCDDDPALASFPENARRRPGVGDLLLGCEDTVAAAQTAVLAAESLGIGSCYIGDVLEHGEDVCALLDLPEGVVPLSLLVMGHKRPPRAGEVSVSCTVDDVPAPSGDGVREAGAPAGVPTSAVGDGVRRPEAPAATPATPAAPATPASPAPAQTPHPVANLVMRDRYRRADAAALDAQVAELDAKFTPHAVAAGAPAGERVRKLYRRKHTSDFMAEMNRSAAWWLARWQSADPGEPLA